MKRLAGFLVLFLITGWLVSFRGISLNDDSLIKIISALNNYLHTYSPEKIYLQTEKSIYIAGDTLWFKAYLLDAATHKPTEQGQIAHLELLTFDYQKIVGLPCFIENGFAAGQFVVPPTLPTGNYLLRAYTRWMQNQDSVFYFTKPLQILNLDTPVTANLNQNFNYDSTLIKTLQLFPEGGNLVHGIASQVAFKATNAVGSGVNVKGIIVDENGIQITSFKSTHLGMGSFYFTPQSNKQYKAIINLPTGSANTFLLPKVQNTGYALQVDNTANDSIITVRIQASSDLTNSSATSVSVLAHTRGIAYYTATGSLTINGTFIARFPKNKLPDGVTHFTVFNALGQPQAERLIFVDRRQTMQIVIQPQKNQFNRREEVVLDITTTDATGKPLAANISVTVSDINQINRPGEYSQNLLTNLLLSSDLSSPVEQPDYYFRNNEDAVKKALDILMLTQGWGRFNWQTVLQDNLPAPFYSREEAFVLNGQAVTGKNNSPFKNSTLYFWELASGASHRVNTDAAGKFSVTFYDLAERNTIFYQAEADEKLLNNIKIILPTGTTIPAKPTRLALNQTDFITLYQQKAKERRTIEQVYQSYVAKPADHVLKPGFLPKLNRPDFNFNLEEYTTFNTVEEVMREIISQVKVVGNKGERQTRVFSRNSRAHFSNQPLYLIDGQPTTNNELILNFPTKDIQNIALFNSSNNIDRFGYFGRYGVIALQTKTGKYRLAAADENNFFTLPGLMKFRSFYQPNYSVTSKNRIPDFRPVIYWNPKVITDTNGKTQVRFHTSDEISKFIIWAEGISMEGKVGTGRAEFLVNTSK